MHIFQAECMDCIYTNFKLVYKHDFGCLRNIYRIIGCEDIVYGTDSWQEFKTLEEELSMPETPMMPPEIYYAYLFYISPQIDMPESHRDMGYTIKFRIKKLHYGPVTTSAQAYVDGIKLIQLDTLSRSGDKPVIVEYTNGIKDKLETKTLDCTGFEIYTCEAAYKSQFDDSTQLIFIKFIPPVPVSIASFIFKQKRTYDMSTHIAKTPAELINTENDKHPTGKIVFIFRCLLQPHPKLTHEICSGIADISTKEFKTHANATCQKLGFE